MSFGQISPLPSPFACHRSICNIIYGLGVDVTQNKPISYGSNINLNCIFPTQINLSSKIDRKTSKRIPEPMWTSCATWTAILHRPSSGRSRKQKRWVFNDYQLYFAYKPHFVEYYRAVILYGIAIITPDGPWVVFITSPNCFRKF